MATDASVSEQRWGAWTGQQRRRCGDRLAADGSEWMICGSRRQRRGCPSRCVLAVRYIPGGVGEGAEGFGLEALEDFGVYLRLQIGLHVHNM